MAIKEVRATSEKFNVLQDALTWKGRVDLDVPKEPAGLSVKTDGRLESGRLDFKMPVEKLNTRHEAMQWEGVIKYSVNENTPRIDLDGTLNMDAVGFESPDAVAAEKRIEWEGRLGAFLPQSEQKPGLLLNGRLNLGELDLALPGNKLAILQDSLTWEGPLVYGEVPQQAPASETGKLRLQNLRVTDIQKSYLLLASKEITADALQAGRFHRRQRQHTEHWRSGGAKIAAGGDKKPPAGGRLNFRSRIRGGSAEKHRH